LVRAILAWRRNKRIDKTHHLVLEINRKLDMLLGEKKREKFRELEKLEKEIVKHKPQLKKSEKNKKFVIKTLFKSSRKSKKR